MLQEKIEEILKNVEGHFAVAIKDLGSDEELMINADEPFVAASIIKVPIMVEVFKQAHFGMFSLEDTITLTQEDQVPGAGILHELTPGLKLPIRDLVKMMIVQSDNTAANMLIDLVGAENVTQTMKEMGLQDTVLLWKLQIVPANRQGYNHLTARDMTRLFTLMANSQVVSWRACDLMIDILKRQQLNNLLPAYLPLEVDEPVGALPIVQMAHKTGEITGVRHDSGIIYHRNGAFAITVLSKDLLDEKAGERALAEIGKAAYEYFLHK